MFTSTVKFVRLDKIDLVPSSELCSLISHTHNSQKLIHAIHFQI